MRFLRGYGTAVGALFMVLGYIASLSAPGMRAYALTLGGFGLLLLSIGLIADRHRVAAALQGRRVRAAGASTLYVVTVVTVVVLVNILAGRHHKRFDLTENRAFSLSEQTVKVLESLPRDVAVTVFYRDTEPARNKLEDLLDEYRYNSDRLSARFIDPDKNPGEVKRFGITQDGTIVFESGEQETRVTASDEESITNALIKVTQDRERIIYFVTGHGERDVADDDRGGLSGLKQELEKQHYVVRPLVLNRSVPDDASMIVIAGADKKFLEAEVKIITEYLERAGRLFLMQDPGVDPGLDGVLTRYGAAIRKDVIIDKISQLFGGDARIPMVAADGYDPSHPVTRTFSYQTFYPMAASVALEETLPEGVTGTALARTSEYSWGETSVEEVESGRIQMNEGVDTQGPVTVGAALVHVDAETSDEDDADDAVMDDAEDDALESPKTPAESRMLLFGDSDFVSNAYFNASGNSDLTLSGIAWLVEQEELVSIRRKTSTASMVVLTRPQAFFYFWTIVVMAPLATVVAGIGVWVRRRKL